MGYVADRRYIAGVVVGDGMLHHSKRRGYEIKITDRYEQYVRYLADLINKTYGVLPSVSKDPRRNAWRLRAYKKELYLAILQEIEQAKAEPDTHFVGGLYDAEGYWNPKKRKLSFTNKDTAIIEIVSRYLSSLGISHSVYQRSRGRYTWYVIETHKRQAEKLISILDLRHPKWGTR